MSHDDRHAPDGHAHGGSAQAVTVIDPVCGMAVMPAQAAGGSETHAGTGVLVLQPSCREQFAADPTRFLAAGPAAPPAAAADTRIYTCPMHPEVVPADPARARSAAWRSSRGGRLAADDGPSPELVDMTRRFWVSAGAHAPGLRLAMAEMAAPAAGATLDPAARAVDRSCCWRRRSCSGAGGRSSSAAGRRSSRAA